MRSSIGFDIHDTRVPISDLGNKLEFCFSRLFVSRSGDDEVRGVGYLGSSGTPLLYDHNKPIGVNPGLRLFYLNVST